MMTMPPKPVTRNEFDKTCDEIKEVKALVWEIKDNHLKHLQSEVKKLTACSDDLDLKMDAIIGSQKTTDGKLSILLPFVYSILGISVLAGLATLFEKLF